MLSSDRVTTIFQLLAGEDQTLKDQSTNWIIFLALSNEEAEYTARRLRLPAQEGASRL